MVPNVVLKRIQINEELVKTNYEFLVPNIHHELIYNCWTISDKTEDSESREGRFSNHSRLRLPSHLLWIERRTVGTGAPPILAGIKAKPSHPKYLGLKFTYSEKATKSYEISTVDLSYVAPVKSTVGFRKTLGPSQNI